MGNSVGTALGDEQELEVRASVVIRKRNLSKKGEGERKPRRNVNSGKRRLGDGYDHGQGNGSCHLHPQHEDHDDHDEESDGDYDDRQLQLQLLHEEEEGKAPVRKRRRRVKSRRDRHLSPPSLEERPLSSSSKVSGDDTSNASPPPVPAKKRSRGNYGRPASVTICSDTDKPSIDIRITRSHLFPNFTLNLPPGFVRAHINVGMDYRVINGGSCQWLSVHESGRRFMVKRQGWRQFVEDQELGLDDLVHVEVFGGNQVIKMEVFRSTPGFKPIEFDEESDKVESDEEADEHDNYKSNPEPGELEQLIFGMVPVPIE